MDFILTEDALTAAETRRLLAAAQITGTRVGNMDALLQTLEELWLLQPPHVEWDRQLRQAALSLGDAFWARSIQADEARTLLQLSQGLKFLLEHVDLGAVPTRITSPLTRQERYFNDLVRLHEEMSRIRPAPQMVAVHWYDNRQLGSIEPLNVHVSIKRDRLSLWQNTLIDALPNLSAQSRSVTALTTAMHNINNRNPSLKSLTSTIFKPEKNPVESDRLHWLTCRDVWEEIEAVTAMTQEAIRQGTLPAQIAIVIPKSSTYTRDLVSALTRAGILLSNASAGERIQDWQTALLYDLIQFKRNPDIPMARMSVLINPLMPWSNACAHRFAEQTAEDRSPSSDDDKQQGLLDALFQREVGWQTDSLIEWLRGVTDRCRAIQQYGLTQKRMVALIDQLEDLLCQPQANSLDLRLDRALTQMPPGEITLDGQAQRFLNAVTLVKEDQVLPFEVKELFLLGFNEGSYEYTPEKSGPIPREQWSEVGSRAGIEIPTVKNAKLDWQEQFRDLLTCAQNRITFTLAQIQADGRDLVPSESLIDFALCLRPASNLAPERLLEPASSFRHPLLTENEVTTEVKSAACLRDLELETNLLNEKNKKRKKPIAESPSSLEKLMLSPLAWILDRFHLKSRQWSPLAADPLIQGSVAHRVFELFASHPEVNEIDARFEAIFKRAIREEADFMNRPEWMFEQRQLRQQVFTALHIFLTWCKENNWKIDEVETRLEGSLWGIAVSGLADAVLRSSNQILILDYKKSKHESYLKRLKRGYDLQNYIYRSLFGSRSKDRPIASGYFTMNDAYLISDHPLTETPGLNVCQPGIPLQDQSFNASEKIRKRIRALKKGTINLNTKQDAEDWNKLGVKPYLLVNSPESTLIRRFTYPQTEAEE